MHIFFSVLFCNRSLCVFVSNNFHVGLLFSPQIKQTNKDWVRLEDNKKDHKKLNESVNGNASSEEEEDDIFSMASPWDKR